MSEIAAPSGDEEDKAQSTLGSQSALLSMLNMASKFGHELPDIDDDEEDTSDEEEDLHSSGASSVRLKRDSSGEFDQHGESEESDSDRALDLAALRRSRLQNPGKISMFGSISGRKIDDDDDLASAEKVKKLFDLPSTEKIITEFPAWLVKNVMIQGYMLLTERHICFFAQLPRTNDTVIKTGYLYKKSRNTPRRHRHWFVLKNDVLSYYDDPADLYFPSGNVDLRYALNAEMDEKDEKHKGFNVYTPNRIYHLRADSDASARQWVKQLQKVIFKSRNQGNNVKISIPIANVLEIEEVHLLGSSDTLKMTVLDNDESFAMDEFYFSFFSRTREAFTKLQTCLNATPDESKSKHTLRVVSSEPSSTTKFKDSVKDTTTFIHAPSPTADNFDGGPSSPRHSSESIRGDIMDDADLLASGQSSPKRRSLRLSRAALRHFSLGSFNSGRRSPSPSPLRTSSDGFDRISHSRTSSTVSMVPQEEPSWSDTGKMLWSRGVNVADWMKERSAAVGTQVGSLLSSPTSTLNAGVGKVSQFWTGDTTKSEHAKWVSEETAKDMKDQNPEERFQTHFALPPSEKLLGAYYGYVFRTFPFYGKMYISKRYFCFRSLLPGIKTKMVLPIKDIETARKEKAYHWSNFGLVVVIRGHEELFFEFGQEAARDECLRFLTSGIEAVETESVHSRELPGDDILGLAPDQIWFQTSKNLDDDRFQGIQGDLSNLAERSEEETPAVMFDSNAVSMVSFKPTEQLRFTCLTIGSRGDVQPYVALCKEGHHVKIASHAEYREWVEGHGIEFAPIEGDPAELMRICVEHGMFTVSFLKEVNSKFRGWLDGLLVSSWHACKNTDVLIESPSTMAGIHIAEAMKIPYFRAFTMPWTRTRTYPHAFAVPDVKMGGGYNYMTYTIFDNLFWKASAGQINRWRKRHLGLRSTNLDKMQVTKVPFLYNFSPSVVPPPLDWVDWIIVTGYWFLDDADSTTNKKWEPPQDIVEFIAKAREDNKKIVYIGFGSIVVSDPKALTETVIESVKNADVRCILSKGWSDRLGDKNAQKTEVPLPDYILSVQSAPHDWLFPQIDAAVHHGGAGTTGASLRAGLVTVIKPYFGDQYFWANRVEDLGVGLSIRKLNVGNFSKALKDATSNEKMIAKAKAIGELIRKENGVATAIQAIYRDMEYAKSLIKQRDSPAPDILSDESWTMIDDEKSPVEELPEFKSARFQDKHDESRLGRLSKKFNLSTATTTLNPIGWNRALKQRNEQKRHELEGRPSELDVADVKTIHGGD